MKKTKKQQFEKIGWRIGTVQEFLGLSDQEMALIELKRTLARKIRAVREANKITQQQLAKTIKSS